MSSLGKTMKSYGPAVGVASAQVLGPNPRRKAILFSPSTTQAIVLNFGQAAVSGEGITLPANGHNLILTEELFGPDITLGVFALAGGATNLPIIEVSGP